MKNYKILIADDDHDFVTVLQTRLESRGFDVVCAHEGIRAIDLAHKEKPDLILLDWKMPAGGGEPILKYLSEKGDTRGIPVIVITGMSESSIEATAIGLGAKAVIRKPYDPVSLIEAISKALQGSAVR
jgi:CheY-like chemotaxis protein